MAVYGCIYFNGDKSLSVVPQTKCVLRQSFEEGNEVEVSWKDKKGARQIWLGVIVKKASKEKKAALEKYADFLNKIVQDHVEKHPNVSPRDILLRHASECDLETYGEENQPSDKEAKRKRATDGGTSKQAAKRRKSTPLTERDQNLNDDAVKKKAAAQAKKMAVKVREVSSVKAMQEMQTSMGLSKNFQTSFPSTTQAFTQQQAKEGSSKVSAPVVMSGLETPTAQLNNGQHRNAIAQSAGQHQAKERPEVRTSLVVTGLQTQRTQNKGQKENAITQNPGEHQARERSDVRNPLVVRGLQTPTAQYKGQKVNAITQHPGQHQANGSSEVRNPLVIADLRKPNAEVRGNSCLQAASEAISEESDAFFPESDVTPPNSPVFSDNTCYEVWRSSMTALLEMEDGEFEQMSDLTSPQAKNADRLYDENQKLREENEQLKDQLKKIMQQNNCSHPVPNEEVITFLECFIRHYRSSEHVPSQSCSPLSSLDLQPCKQYVIKANLSPPTNNSSSSTVKLLENYDVFVDRTKLRVALQGVRQKSPVFLLNKLIPLVFSEEELANSCGLGIHNSAKSVQSKLPLDSNKVAACKEYLTAFCIQNEKEYPNTKEVNSAFTQQITYARVKVSRRAKLVDITGDE